MIAQTQKNSESIKGIMRIIEEQKKSGGRHPSNSFIVRRGKNFRSVCYIISFIGHRGKKLLALFLISFFEGDEEGFTEM